MNRLVKKKIVKLEKESKNFNQISEEQQSKVNDVQQKIFEGNQMLEKFFAKTFGQKKWPKKQRSRTQW